MHICIIGNSHIGSLKLAWDSGLAEKHPEVQLVFFGSLTAGIETLVADGQSLKSPNSNTKADFNVTSNGHDQIELPLFDYCLLHGLSPRPMAYMKFISSSKQVFYSQQALTLANPFYQSLAFKLVNEIRKVSEIPIICSPAPNALSAPKEAQYDNATFKEVCNVIELAHKRSGVIYLPQPSSTIHCTYYTDAKYGKGPKNLSFRSEGNIEDSDLSKKDFRHMNGEFGKKTLGEGPTNDSTG